jgi:TRAP-type C4-dicarboxylate transport system permease small subunit
MERAYRVLCRTETIVAGTCLLGMVALVLIGGVARLSGRPMNWTGDVATCLFAWACFLCANIAWRNGALMSVDFLTDRLPLRVRHALGTLNFLLITAFLVYVIGAGFWLSWVSRARTFQGIPEVSYSVITLSLPVGGLLLLLTTLLKLSAHLRGDRSTGATA